MFISLAWFRSQRSDASHDHPTHPPPPDPGLLGAGVLCARPVDLDVNAWLVEHGYAAVMTVPPNVKHQGLFLKLQREAREAKRGL